MVAVGGGGVAVAGGFVGVAVGGDFVGLGAVVGVGAAVVAVAAAGEADWAARVAVACAVTDGAAVGVTAGVGESGTGVGVEASSEPPQVAAMAREAQQSSPAAGRITDFRTAISPTLHRWKPARARYIDGMRFVDGNSCLEP
ncbi:MAG: hypothetical protein IH609_00795 [Dehalococcoidia bacterium]|nr:hypothetical protein [Dehalococcoidia bacterium]